MKSPCDLPDEDNHDPKVNSIEQAFKKAAVKSPKPNGKAKPAESAKIQQKTSVADFFGTAVVKQSEPRTSRKSVATPKKDEVVDDVEMHDDDDFEKTLLQLDETCEPSPAKKVGSI